MNHRSIREHLSQGAEVARHDTVLNPTQLTVVLERQFRDMNVSETVIHSLSRDEGITDLVVNTHTLTADQLQAALKLVGNYLHTKEVVGHLTGAKLGFDSDEMKLALKSAVERQVVLRQFEQYKQAGTEDFRTLLKEYQTGKTKDDKASTLTERALFNHPKFKESLPRILDQFLVIEDTFLLDPNDPNSSIDTTAPGVKAAIRKQAAFVLQAEIAHMALLAAQPPAGLYPGNGAKHVPDKQRWLVNIGLSGSVWGGTIGISSEFISRALSVDLSDPKHALPMVAIAGVSATLSAAASLYREQKYGPKNDRAVEAERLVSFGQLESDATQDSRKVIESLEHAAEELNTFVHDKDFAAAQKRLEVLNKLIVDVRQRLQGNYINFGTVNRIEAQNKLHQTLRDCIALVNSVVLLHPVEIKPGSLVSVDNTQKNNEVALDGIVAEYRKKYETMRATLGAVFGGLTATLAMYGVGNDTLRGWVDTAMTAVGIQHTTASEIAAVAAVAVTAKAVSAVVDSKFVSPWLDTKLIRPDYKESNQVKKSSSGHGHGHGHGHGNSHGVHLPELPDVMVEAGPLGLAEADRFVREEVPKIKGEIDTFIAVTDLRGSTQRKSLEQLSNLVRGSVLTVDHINQVVSMIPSLQTMQQQRDAGRALLQKVNSGVKYEEVDRDHNGSKLDNWVKAKTDLIELPKEIQAKIQTTLEGAAQLITTVRQDTTQQPDDRIIELNNEVNKLAIANELSKLVPAVIPEVAWQIKIEAIASKAKVEAEQAVAMIMLEKFLSAGSPEFRSFIVGRFKTEGCINDTDPTLPQPGKAHFILKFIKALEPFKAGTDGLEAMGFFDENANNPFGAKQQRRVTAVLDKLFNGDNNIFAK